MLCLVAGGFFFFFFTYYRSHEMFYKLFIIKHTKSLPISVRRTVCVASVSVLFRSKERLRNGIFARSLTVLPRS